MPASDVPRLAELTTLRVGGPARKYLRATTTEELVEAVRACDERGEPLLVLGGGSNLVVADAGFDGTVVHVATRGVAVESDDSCGGVHLNVAAGEPWDDFVAHTVEQGWAGLECLAGIPGLAGATPIQNVGAYGQEVATTSTRVRVWDRVERAVRTFANADCGFGYRTSRFKGTDRYVVLSVDLGLRDGDLSEPVRYAELARTLGVEVGQRAPLVEVRETVLRLRASKGMVLNAADHDTWSAGSFFTNPILTASEADELLPADAPRWTESDGRVKTSAAWLIERAGFSRGYAAVDGSPASLSTKHTLAVTNRGSATTDDVLVLARTVRDGVQARFGVTLVPEPRLVGCAL